MKRIAKISLIISIIMIVFLFQPKFHRPPIEIQDRIIRLFIEYLFFISIGTGLISGFLLLPSKVFKILYSIPASSLFLGIIVGIFFTAINKGGTYLDNSYYINSENGQKIIFQYYDHGAFGSSSRFVKVKPILGKIRFIRIIDPSEIKGNWIVTDVNGNFIEKISN